MSRWRTLTVGGCLVIVLYGLLSAAYYGTPQPMYMSGSLLVSLAGMLILIRIDDTPEVTDS